MGLAGYLIGMVNLMTALVAFLVMGVGIGIGGRGECGKFARWRLVVVALAMLAISVVGMVGAWYNRAWRVMYVYVGMVVLAELLLLAVSITAVVLLSTQAAAGLEKLLPQDPASSAVYKLPSASSASASASSSSSFHSNWLQSYLLQPRTWDVVKSCFSTFHLCRHTPPAASNLSPVQSGCCVPPRECKPTSLLEEQKQAIIYNTTSEDCLTWSDNQFCFDCSSCKGGVLQTLRESQRKVAEALALILFSLTIVLLTGCRALQSSNKSRRRGATFFPKIRGRKLTGVHPSEDE